MFPISAFVAAGFEHCAANMYLIPLGIFLKDSVAATANIDSAELTWSGFTGSLIPVTLGNIIGSSVMLALVYCTIYRRGLKS